MSLNQLFKLDAIAKKGVSKYSKKRFIYEDIEKGKSKGNRFISIVGPRGVGKTVLLRQIAVNDKTSFYVSMDTFEEKSLFDFAKVLSENYGIKLLLIDEIHFLKKYDAELKKIFDFLDVNIIFTSSVSLSLYESAYDLSRRVKLIKLYPFSFSEYIYFRESVKIAPLSIFDILNGKWTRDHLRWSYLFEDYLKGGLFPFSMENYDVLDIMKNILHKIISKDIPVFANLRMEEVDLIYKTFRFISNSSVEDINYSSVSQNIGITKHKARQYLELLQKAFVINIVMPYGTNVLKEPKILMCLPFRLIYKDYKEVVGALREDFSVQCLTMKGYNLFYLKSPRGGKTPDFFIKENNEKFVVEVGGKGKGRSQFKDFKGYNKVAFVHGDIFNDKFKKPLFLLGYLSYSGVKRKI